MPVRVDLVLAHLVLGQLREQLGRARSDPSLRMPFGRQLEAALLALDEAGLLQHLGQLGQALQRAGGVVAEQVADPVDVGLGQRAGVGRAPQQFSSWSMSPSSSIMLPWPRRTRAGPGR